VFYAVNNVSHFRKRGDSERGETTVGETSIHKTSWGYFEWTEQIISTNPYKVIQTFFVFSLYNDNEKKKKNFISEAIE
jgi:hypothetical protein